VKPPHQSDSCIEDKHGVSIEIDDPPVSSPPAVRRVAGREKYEPAHRIHIDQAPQARPGTILPTVGSPGLVARPSGLRHGMKPPGQFPGAYVERARVAAGTAAGSFLRTGPDDRQVAGDRGRR